MREEKEATRFEIKKNRKKGEEACVCVYLSVEVYALRKRVTRTYVALAAYGHPAPHGNGWPG